MNDHQKVYAAYYQKNKGRIKARTKKYREDNKEKTKKYSLNQKLKRYGLTKELYDRMYMEQLGLCAICHEPFGDENPHIDHCHKSKKVRGLVHRKCNLLLGHADDSILNLHYGIEYLSKKKCDATVIRDLQHIQQSLADHLKELTASVN